MMLISNNAGNSYPKGFQEWDSEMVKVVFAAVTVENVLSPNSKNTLLQKNIAIDMQVLRELEVEEQEYIFLALQNYLKCLRVSSEHDLHMHRVVALWLENTQQKINQLVSVWGQILSSHFILLLPHIHDHILFFLFFVL